MKVLVLGADGQVGHALLGALPRRLAQTHGTSFELVAATRRGHLENGTPCERIDLSELDGLRAAIECIRADVVINAAAWTAVDRAEDEPELAQRVNGDALAVLGAVAREQGSRIVHFSTDYVFDGSSDRAYREDDAVAPLGAYGRSKLAGEVALRESGADHLIVRTAWVYAARGQNFLRTMLRLARERGALRVVADQWGTPTPATLIADTVAAMITAPSSEARRGTFHLVARGRTSWHGFARAIVDGAHARGLLPASVPVAPIATAEFPTRARRPRFSVLDPARLEAAFGLAMPDWASALAPVLDELSRIDRPAAP